jgi:transcriptional regulator with XRE-family HTH domain
MKMNIPEFLQRIKNERGLSDADLSRATGMSVDSLYDVLLHENEFDMYGLPNLLKLCDALSITLADVYQGSQTEMSDKTLAQIIKSRRKERELSVKELSVLIGFEPSVIEVLENNGDLSLVCMEAFKSMAKALDLPLVPLLGKLQADRSRYSIPAN